MNLGDLCRWAEGVVPEAGEGVLPSISTTQLCKRDILNQGANEFVKFTRCMPKDKKFNCVANTSSYSITTNLPDYLEMKEEGLWHYRSDTSSTTWERLEPTTARVLDETFSTWRSQSTNDYCQKYWTEGDFINVFYTPSTSRIGGFWAYYYANSSDMSTLNTVPFTGGTTQESRLVPFEKILFPYYEFRALGILGYKDDAVNKELEFYKLCEKSKMDMNSQRDVAQNSKARPKTGLNYYRSAFKRNG